MFKKVFFSSFFFSELVQAAGENGGMPQLNPESFSSQIFWLIVLFSFLFLVNHYIFLPRLEKVRKKRDETIDENLNEAKKINESINSLIEKMKKDFDEAKNQQNLAIKNSYEKNKVLLDEKIHILNEEFDNKKINLTKSVESNKLKILQNLPSICVKLSDNLYEKIMEEKIEGNINEFNKIVGENSNES